MNNDIVDRLRAWIPCYRADTDIAIDMAKAADEIERLRLRVKELEGLIDSAMEADYNNEYFKTHHK